MIPMAVASGLIIGDRATGKTIAIDTIINQANINNQHRNEDGTFQASARSPSRGRPKTLTSRARSMSSKGAMEYTIIVGTCRGYPANQYIAPFSGASMVSSS